MTPKSQKRNNSAEWWMSGKNQKLNWQEMILNGPSFRIQRLNNNTYDCLYLSYVRSWSHLVYFWSNSLKK